MARRGHNEGSIHKRPDGRWVGVLHLGYKDGKRDRKYFYGKTQKEARQKLEAAKRDLERGLPVDIERQTVAQFLDRWLADVVRPKVRPSTYDSYAGHVRLYLKPTLGHHQLTKLTPQHVQSLLNEKLAAGLSPRTVQYMRSVLRNALNQAMKWDLVARNVATLVDPPRSRRPEVRPLTPEQARAFLGAVKGDRLEGLFTVAVALGLRQGEALGLRWEDIDLDAGTLRVRHTIQKINGEWCFVEPKTDRSRRTIVMPAATITALRAHRRRQAEERLAAGARWQDWHLVFPSAVGTPLNGSNVTHRLQRILESANLPRQRFHDLRHCCASLLLAQHVPMRVVMEILGHSQISLTMDTYSHVMPALQHEAASLMDAILTNSQ
jgi:integrase